MKKFKLELKKNSKFIIFTIVCLSMIITLSLYYLKHYNKLPRNYTKNNVVVKTDDLNLEYDELPKEHRAISMVNSSNILLENEEGIWLYDRDKNEKKLISKVLNKDHVFGKVVYSNDWVVWIEDSDKVFDGNEIGKSWIVAAKNIYTNEQIIIDKSHDIKNLKYRYAPNDIDISNDTIVYNHVDFQDDEYMFLVKTYNISIRKLDVIEKIVDISDKWITDVSIYNNKIVWSNPNTLSVEGSKRYKYSDLYLYNIDTNEKTKLASGEYMLEQCIYKDKVFTVNLNKNGLYNYDELIEIDINTKERRKIIDRTNPIVKDLGGADDGVISLGLPQVNSDLLTWWLSGVRSTKENFYYDLKNNEFKSLGENKFVSCISNGYIIYSEYNEEGTSSKKRIVPIEE